MASVLPFNSATLDEGAVASSDFVYGSGSLEITGDDIVTTTGDNTVHHDRKTRSFAASMELYGDQRSLNTPAGASVEQTIAGETFNGIVTATYDDDAKTTSVEVKGDPQTS